MPLQYITKPEIRKDLFAKIISNPERKSLLPEGNRRIKRQDKRGFPSAVLPSAGEEIAHADHKGHKAGQSIAVPEALAAHIHGKAQQSGNADAADHAVNNSHGEIQLGIARAVDEGKADGAGSRAEEIEDGGDHQNMRHRQHRFIGGEHAVNRFREEADGNGAGNGDDRSANAHGHHNAGHPLVFLRPQILAHHGAAGGGKGLGNDADHHIHLVIKPGQSGIDHAVGIDPGHQHDLGNIDGGGLNGHGHAQGHQALQGGGIDLEAFLFEIEAEIFLMMIKVNKGYDEAEGLADHGGQSGAHNLHFKAHHEKQIQNNIHHRRNGNEHEGAAAIAHAAENGADDIIAVNEDKPHRADHGIIHGEGIGFRGGIEQLQNGMAENKAEDRNQKRNRKEEGEHGADGFFHAFHAPAAHILGDQHLAGGGKAHGHEGEQMQNIAARGNGAHAGAADILAHHHHIHDIIDGLEGIGNKERESEFQQQFCYIAPRKIGDHGFGMGTHGETSSFFHG